MKMGPTVNELIAQLEKLREAGLGEVVVTVSIDMFQSAMIDGPPKFNATVGEVVLRTQGL